MPVVRDIVRDASRQDYRFASLLTGIVRSVPFQMRRTGSLNREGREVAGNQPKSAKNSF